LSIADPADLLSRRLLPVHRAMFRLQAEPLPEALKTTQDTLVGNAATLTGLDGAVNAFFIALFVAANVMRVSSHVICF